MPECESILDEETVKLSDIYVSIGKFSHTSYGPILFIIDKIRQNNQFISSIHLDSIEKVEFFGTVLQFDSFENEKVVWNSKYGEKIEVK
jgi:hypothetical protein